MKSREQIIEQFVAELRGHLLEAFAESRVRVLSGNGGRTPDDDAAVGRYMTANIVWAKEFLGRVADWAADEPPAKVSANGVKEAGKEKAR